MTAKIWTLLTVSDTVEIFYDKTAVERAAMQAVIDYGPDGWLDYEEKYGSADFEITLDNWRQVLADLNEEVKSAGHSTYLATIAEHEFPKARIAIVSSSEGAPADRILVDSPLLDGLEVAVIETGFDPRDYSNDDIMEIKVPGRSETAEYIGHLATPEAADLGEVFTAVENKENGAGFKP